MKFSIEKEILLSGLSKIQNIAEKKATLPVLSFVLFDAKENFLVLTATDMEVGIKVSLPAHVDISGEIALPAKKLYEVIREFPNKEISFEVSENFSTKISHEKIIFNLLGLEPDQFPNFPKIKENFLFDISSSILKKMIDRTYFAMSNDEGKYNLNGIFFQKLIIDDEIYIALTSTDIHRLAFTREKLKINDESLFSKGGIIPKKGITEIRKLVENTDANINVGFFDNNAVFIKDNINIIIRLVDGEFPEYQKVIPEISSNFVSISQDTFLKVLRRVSTLTNERYRGIRLTFYNQYLEIYVNNPEFGEAKEEIPLDYEGQEISIAYNARYLIDAVNAYQTDYLRFQFKDNISPAVITPVDHTDSLAVIMPMRL
ncbi:MAG: DNA polymerase III subunit beta [Desulfuromonadaceae bacterium]|nr:DNA polymerase III subunit beta [Desulfuromonadaceae bacterium]